MSCTVHSITKLIYIDSPMCNLFTVTNQCVCMTRMSNFSLISNAKFSTQPKDKSNTCFHHSNDNHSDDGCHFSVYRSILKSGCKNYIRENNTTARTKVVNDLFHSLDKGNISVLALLYFFQHLKQLIILSLYTVSILTLYLVMLSFNGFHLI